MKPAIPKKIHIQSVHWIRSSSSYIAPPLIAILITSAAWEIYVTLAHISEFILPRPSIIIVTLLSEIKYFAVEGLQTFWVATSGLAIGMSLALLLAAAMAHSSILERALLPIAIMVKVTPIVAIAPLFIIWFGFGWEPKVAIAALITYFPILINGIVGFRDIDQLALDFMRSINASKREIFVHLRLPNGLPYLLAALKISSTLSLIGAVVAEFFAAGQGGLGSVIFIANNNQEIDKVFAAVITLATIGILTNSTIILLERYILSWHRTNAQL